MTSKYRGHIPEGPRRFSSDRGEYNSSPRDRDTMAGGYRERSPRGDPYRDDRRDERDRPEYRNHSDRSYNSGSRSPRGEFMQAGENNYRPDYSIGIRSARHSSPTRATRPSKGSGDTSLTGSPYLERQTRDDNATAPERPVRPRINTSQPVAPDPENKKDIKANQEKLANDLADVFKTVIQSAIEIGALKNQQAAAEKDLIKKTNDYNKSKSMNMHTKFPATEDSQKRLKTTAKKAVEDLEAKLKDKNIILQKATLESATKLAIAQGSAQSQNETSELEKTCKQLKVQLQEQRTFVEGFINAQKQAEKQARLDTDNKIQAQAEVTAQINATLKRHTEDIGSLNRHTAGVPDMKLKLNRLENVEKMVNDISTLQNQSVSSTIVNDLSAQVLAIKRSIDTKDVSVLVDQIEKRQAVMEEKQKHTTLFLNNLSLDALKPRLDQIDNDRAEETKRSASLQLKVMSLRTEVNKLSETDNAPADIRNALASLKGQDVKGDLTSVTNRVMALERGSKGSGEGTSLAVTAAKHSPRLSISFSKEDIRQAVSEELKVIPEEIREFIQESQTAVDDTMAQIIEHRCGNLENEIASIKASNPTGQLSAQQEAINRLHTDLASAKTSIVATSVSQIIAAIQQPGSVPLNLIAESVFQSAAKEIHKDIHQGFSVNAQAIETKMDEKLKNYAVSNGVAIQGLNARIDDLTGRVDANEFACANIDTRIQNINTTDLALHMISQLDTTYPLVRNAQTMLQTHSEKIDLQVQNIEDLTNRVIALEQGKSSTTAKSAEPAAQTSTAQMPIAQSPVAQTSIDSLVESLKDITNRIDPLEQSHISNIGQVIDDLQSQMNAHSTDLINFSNRLIGIEQRQTTTSGSDESSKELQSTINDLVTDLKKISEKIASIEALEKPTTDPAMSSLRTQIDGVLVDYSGFSTRICSLENRPTHTSDEGAKTLQGKFEELACKLQDLASKIEGLSSKVDEVRDSATKATVTQTADQGSKGDDFEKSIGKRVAIIEDNNLRWDIKIANTMSDKQVIPKIEKSLQEVYTEAIPRITKDISRIDSELQKIRQSAVSKPTSISAPRAPSQSLSTNGHTNAKSFSSNHSTSVQGDGSNKKRKLNGSPSVPSPYKGTNGMNSNGIKKKKKSSRTSGRYDTPDDEDLEPKQPRITILDSDDEV